MSYKGLHRCEKIKHVLSMYTPLKTQCHYHRMLYSLWGYNATQIKVSQSATSLTHQMKQEMSWGK